ncbi:type I-E CRISPR-associated protein Cse1/CasA [Agrobacterium sp. a22-2]|uniref:type I-E CRISPR-associated protein Cse1/CasA n=1 Tax=Agrobacterium sp. a22-2 TaxID=2283840 RepID=UPI0014463924|nr:type I-E CRISPR-associated protein Cse1/CasA [Agrobacterium sp. a22-2]NKN38466.1 type I-E CRISPR-associated protein Cse1/CasA [Agrobacterium sp. a22-2]
MSDESCAFNLIADAFFPVATVSGARRWLTFSELRQEEGDYPVAFDWPRGDLNIAAFEFAVGVLALAYQPEDNADWTAIWRGRSDIDLDERLAALAFAFNLTGDVEGMGPRFLQDFGAIDGEANDIEALFIDTPGVNGQKKNADLLTHRGRFPALGLKAAAIALYALQQFAPSGGNGHRTSLRGGGPMTTLVWLDSLDSSIPAPLWRVLLANLPLSSKGAGYLDDTSLERALPWLAAIITPPGKEAPMVPQMDDRVHALQAFFGMPRRIRLDIAGHGTCPLTGEAGPLVTGFFRSVWGVNYDSNAWRHPLTPYRQKEPGPTYSVKVKTSRFGYRDWVGAVIGRRQKLNAFPAEPVASLLIRSEAFRQSGFKASRIVAAGWAVSSAEANCFLQSAQPLHLAEDAATADELARLAIAFADAGDAAAGILRGNLKLALFGDGAKTATDSGVFEEASDAFFERTEDAFHAALEAIVSDHPPDGQVSRKRWLMLIRRKALDLFDLHATVLLAETADIKVAMRVTEAYRRLRGALGEVGKVATALGIDQPIAPEKPKKSRKAAEEARA